MGTPTLTAIGARLYAALAPLAREDAAHGYALAQFMGAAALPLDLPARLALDDPDTDATGWSILWDLDRVPTGFLPWVGQFVGVNVPGYLDAEAQRLRVRETDGFRRGSPGAIIGAARQTLTGTGTVYLTERHGSAYRLTVATLTSETPDPAWTLREVEAQTPGGIVVAHELVDGGDFQTLRDTHADFQTVADTFVDFAEVSTNPAKQ